MDWQVTTRDFGGITIITSGAHSPSSAVLLESDGMTKLLDQLQKEFDLIIIDGPPLFIEDSLIMAAKVGGILLVIRQGGTITASAHAMLDQLNLLGASVLGVVLNRVPRRILIILMDTTIMTMMKNGRAGEAGRNCLKLRS